MYDWYSRAATISQAVYITSKTTGQILIKHKKTYIDAQKF